MRPSWPPACGWPTSCGLISLVGPAAAQERLVVLLWLVPLQLVLLALFLQLSPLLGYFSTPDLARMFYALVISAGVAMGVWFALGSRLRSAAQRDRH